MTSHYFISNLLLSENNGNLYHYHRQHRVVEHQKNVSTIISRSVETPDIILGPSFVVPFRTYLIP